MNVSIVIRSKIVKCDSPLPSPKSFLFLLRWKMRGLVRAEVLLAEVVRCRGVQFRGQDFHVGKGGHHHRGGHRRAEQIRQDDGRFGDSVVFQYVDGLLVGGEENG